MRQRSIRLTATVAVLGLLCLGSASGASAAITSTRLALPADGSYFLQEASGSSAEVTIKGTVESSGAPGSIQLSCYADPGSTVLVETIEEEELLKTGPGRFSFSVTVPVEEFGESPCVLRAVPEGSTTFLPPGASTDFEGALVAFSEIETGIDKADGATFSYDLEARTLSTIFEVVGAGQCGLGPTALLSSPGLAPSEELFECAGALYGHRGGATRADIQVDGHNAYDPAAADVLYRELKPTGTAPSGEFKPTFDSATGLTTIRETDPLVECAGKTVAYPETSESCEALHSAGVTLERTWTPTAGGRLITMVDAWHSTDGAEHTISALYRQELNGDTSSPGTYEFPAAAPSFTATKTGEAIALGPGGATILYREDGTAAETVGGAHPIGALILESSPSEAVQATEGSAETVATSSLTMPYSLKVAASAYSTVTMAFAEGYTVAEVCALAEAAGSQCPHPAVSAPVVETRAGTTITAKTPSDTAASPSVPGVAKAHRQAPAKVVQGGVAITISCSGAAGSSCVLRGALTTLEKLRGGRPHALAAGTRTLTVGALAASIPAGATRTIKIKLNSAGRALLSRFHKLPLHLGLRQQGVAGPAASLASQSLTIVLGHR